MINNINKNVSVWRGDKTPPTEYHVWIKSDGSILINRDGTWFTQISESTNDSVNVCNLSDSRHLTLEEALDIVAQYLGADVFHAGYKIRFNITPNIHTPNVWKEYIFTAPTLGNILYKQTQFWKLVAASDLFDSNGEIRSQYLPSYVDDVLEFESIDLFPEVGESDKIYLDTSTNKSYRWSGTQYVLIALTDIVTSESDGLMSSEMYNKLEKTASDLDIHDKQNQADFAEIRQSLDKKVGKIVDSQGNIISNNASIATIPDATSQSAGLMTSDDKIKLDSIEPEFVKDLGLVASTDKGDQLAAKSEIAGNVKISFIRYRTAGVRAERVTTIFQWRNGVNETAQLKFVDKAQWRRNVIGATGVEGATTSTTPWERTGAHYLGYDAASRTLQLKDYNQTVFRTVQLPLAQNDADAVIDGLVSSADIASIITKAEFNRWTGEIYLKNKANNQVTSLVIPPATKDGMGLMSENDVIEMGTLTEHRIDRNNPHNVTKAQVGLSNVTNDAQVKRSEMGVANGVALLNSDGKIPSSYLPSYVSDIITADSYTTLPTTGEEDKIYVTKDTNLTYRWSGTAYVEISPSIALGETSTTAYAGDKGASLAASVQNLELRVGSGWLDTETKGFAYIGTGSSRVKIVPGADILASVVGQGTSFTISSNTDTASIGYGANIGKGSKLGQNISATVESVRDPNGALKSALVLQDTTDDLCLKVLCRNNGEFKLSTSTNTSDTKGWVDLARMENISTMIDVGINGLAFYPSRLTGNSNDTDIILGTHTTIGSNVTIGSYSGIGEGIKIAEHGESNAWIIGTAISLGEINGNTAYIGKGAQISNYVKVSASIRDDGTGYVLLGDGTTKIKKGVTIDGNSGSSEQRVHEYTRNDLDSWIIGTNPTPNTTGVQLGKGIIILGTSQLNQPILIKAQNRNNATALIGADFNAYSGVTLGSYSSLGNQAKLGDNVEIIQGASGLTIVSNDYGMTVGTKVSIGNNVSLGNNSWLGQNSYLASGSHMGENSAVQGNVQISTGVQIDESLTSDDAYYRLGETSTASIIIKNCAIEANIKHNSGANQIQIEDTNHTKYLYTGSGNTFGENNTIGNNVIISNDVSISTSVSVSDTGDEVSVGNVTISTGIRITKNASATTIQNGNDSSTAGGKLQFGTGNVIWSGAEIGTGVHITEDLTADSTSYKLGGTNQVIISKGINIYYSDTKHALQIIAPTTDGGSLYSFGNVQLGTNFQVSSDVSLGISLGTGSIDAVSYYQLKDPKNQLLTSSIGAGVTIQSGIQIKESDSGGIQIYVPSQAKWITIN